VAEIVAQRDPNDRRPVILMPQDEGRFGRINYCNSSCWAPKGIRPKTPRQIVRTSTYVYSAVCSALGKMTSLILPYANTEMMNIFLQHVGEEFKEYFVIMIIDGAGWHRSASLILPENIRLLPLPPYSPELNPVEHIWDYLRENAMPNIAFKSLHQLEDALCRQLRDLENDPERIQSMTNFPYLRITLN
jgi:transposase